MTVVYDGGHIGLRPQCGICGGAMMIHEKFVALLENGTSTASSNLTKVSTFPDYGQNIRLHTSPISEDLISIPLSEILAWERGGLPVLAYATPPKPIVRLTIDSHGVRKVERLPKKPLYRGQRSDSAVFVILEENSLKRITMHCKFGYSRLELHDRDLCVQVWDTPTPPDPDQCMLSQPWPANSAQFRTINLNQSTGLTFFFDLGNVYAIHSHTVTTPCARQTYERLSRRRQRSVTWLYLPIPPNDDVVLFGLGRADNFLFRMRLAGDIAIGPSYPRDNQNFIFSKSPPISLIHDTADLQRISIVGSYSTKCLESELVAPFGHPECIIPPFQNAYPSWAPLENVIGLQVFYNEENGFCRGLLLEYENGAQRALGQCRIGVDPVHVYINPTHICFLRTTYSPARAPTYSPPRTPLQLKTVRVGCASGEHNHDEKGWVCSGMAANLEFWFTNEQTDLRAMIYD
ncbi:hypothetical protein S40288_08298 [Stachybotrys chartarum IBT 40288]|nr:hypothetical protein S40288_08298 [Stachybotrys chartarum IBT 40288]